MCPIVILGILIISAPSVFFSSFFFFFCFNLILPSLEQCLSTANFRLTAKLGGLQAHLVFHFNKTSMLHTSSLIHFILLLILLFTFPNKVNKVHLIIYLLLI